jgi:hypothetical protein
MLIITIPIGIAQETALYDEDGNLKFDSSYSVDSKLLNTIRNIEGAVYSIYKEIEYPWQLAENGIGGFVIARIHVNNERLDIWCEIVKCSDPGFEDPVVKAVHKQALSILRRTKGLDNFIFYLPFKFEVETSPILKDMNENGN